MDAIAITGIRCYGYTGYFEAERRLGQWFEVDATLWLDLSAAAASDRLEDTLDYGNAVARIRALVQNSRFNLLERLAATIADSLLECDGLQQVRVKLTKVSPPIPDFEGQVAVELTRTRGDRAAPPTVPESTP